MGITPPFVKKNKNTKPLTEIVVPVDTDNTDYIVCAILGPVTYNRKNRLLKIGDRIKVTEALSSEDDGASVQLFHPDKGTRLVNPIKTPIDNGDSPQPAP